MGKLHQITYQNGFTLVEIIVTLFIATLFLLVVLQTTRVSSSQHVTATARMTAANVAQSNLHKFPTYNAAVQAASEHSSAPGSSAPFFCKPGTTISPPSPEWEAFYGSQPTTNLAADANAAGVELLNNESTIREQGDILEPLVNPVQRVAVYAPNGCAQGATSVEQPDIEILKIESTVEYGPPDDRQIIEFSSYVKN